MLRCSRFLLLASLVLGGCAAAPDAPDDGSSSAFDAVRTYSCAVLDGTSPELKRTVVSLHGGEDIQMVRLLDGLHEVELEAYDGDVQIWLEEVDANGKAGKILLSANASESGFTVLDLYADDPLPPVYAKCELAAPR